MPAVGMMILDQKGKKMRVKQFVDKVDTKVDTKTNKKVYNFNYQRSFRFLSPCIVLPQELEI